MKQAYRSIRMGRDRLLIVEAANLIIQEYQKAGYHLTLRQLYYQFVSRDLLPNTQADYKRLGDIVNDGRMAGLIDWTAIEDRTRNLKAVSSWGSPAELVEIAAQAYKADLWANQTHRIEIWVEKEALAGVVERVGNELRLPYFCCRGYVSQSEMWEAGQRFSRYAFKGKKVLVLHLGDHDPSGRDMSRDITDRISLFMGSWSAMFNFRRIALNMDQIQQYRPPPNPAKLTDSRSDAYVKEFGDESWELDALPPESLASLIRTAVSPYRNDLRWARALAAEADERKELEYVSSHWDDLDRGQ